MALTVEDGTGLSSADAFVSLAEGDTYFTNRPEATSVWGAATDAQQEGAIRYATRALSNRYRWPGSIKVETQALAWPRDGAADNEGRDLEDEVPALLKEATIEFARFLLANPINASISSTDLLSAATVGELSVTFKDSAPARAFLPYLDELLAPIVVGGVTTARAIRG